jgi:hypothetical protein
VMGMVDLKRSDIGFVWKPWRLLVIAAVIIPVFWLWVWIVAANPSRNPFFVATTELLYFSFAVGVPALSAWSMLAALIRAIRGVSTWVNALLQIAVSAAILGLWAWTGIAGRVEGI